MSTEIELKQSEKGVFTYQANSRIGNQSNAVGLVDYVEDKILSMLPSNVEPEVFINTTKVALLNNKRLYDCTQESLFKAVLACAEVGLMPGTRQQHCFILPFRVRGVNQATFVLGYHGIVYLIALSGIAKRISWNVIKEGDFVDYQDGYPDYHFKFKPLFDESKRGRITHVFATLTTKDGGFYDSILTYERVEQIRKGAPGKDQDAWKHHWDQMAAKTAFKNLSKKLSVAGLERLQHAVDLDNESYDLEAMTTDEISELDKLLAAPESGDGSEVDAPALEVPKPDTAPQEANMETIPDDIEPAELFKMCDLPGGEERKIAAALLGKDAEGFPSDLSTLTRNHKRKIAASVRIIGADRIFDFMAWAMNNKIAIGTPAAVNAALKNFSKL